VALDFQSEQQAINLIKQLDPNKCRLKIGKEMFTHYGPKFVKGLIEKDFDVFLDLKFHDIPNTVAGAVQAASKLGVWMVNVHALGGLKMLQAAKNAINNSEKKPLLIGVTILTSMDQQELVHIGLTGDSQSNVLRLAGLCHQAGLDGVVCSAQEAPLLRKEFGDDFILVTPGIRLNNSKTDDQQRIMTPKAAVNNGADYLVMGRPITKAINPIQTLDEILLEIKQ